MNDCSDLRENPMFFRCRHELRGPVIRDCWHAVNPRTGRVSKVGAPRDYAVCLNCGEELAVTVFTEPPDINEPQEVGVFRDAKELL